MGSQEATPAAEARMVAEAAMEVLKVAQQALTPCQARGNSAGCVASVADEGRGRRLARLAWVRERREIARARPSRRRSDDNS